MEVRRQLLGDAHPDTARALNFLGIVQERREDLARAEALYREAAEVWKKVEGGPQPDHASTLKNLAGLLSDRGDLDAARKYFEQALAIHRKARGDDSLDVAIVYGNLGQLLRARKDYPAARTHFEQALAIRRKVQGDGHADTVQVVKSLDGVIAAALPPQQRKLRLAERDRLMGEVKTLRDAGKLDEAVAAVEKALAIDREVLGNLHDNVATGLDWLGWLQERRQNFPAAFQARREQLSLYRKLYGDQHWWTIDVRLAGARQAWQKRIDILTRLHGDKHGEVVNARLRLALSRAPRAAGPRSAQAAGTGGFRGEEYPRRLRP